MRSFVLPVLITSGLGPQQLRKLLKVSIMASKKISIEPDGVFASLPRTTRGKSLVLNGDPKKKTFLYTNGNNVIIRDINRPDIAEIVTKHAKPVNVAQYSPSGYYIASADDSGKVYIWDTTNPEHINKPLDGLQPLSGPIRDLAWDPDSKRIAVGGEGREKYGSVFLADSGNTVGGITGSTKLLNAVAYKPTRPYRIAAACEDFDVYFYEGPPFKLSSSIKAHSNFVNIVRYSPSGDVFISGSSDTRAIVFDGKTGEIKGELIDSSVGQTAHKGGIFALCFNDDGSKVITCSGDKTAKIWDVNTRQLLTTFKMGDTLGDQQLGCLWQGEHIITISLHGYINFLDQDNPEAPKKIIKGTNKPITCMAVTADRSRVYTGSSDSHINFMDVKTFEDDDMKGKPHGNQVNDMVVDGQELITVAMDDTIKFSDEFSGTYGESIKLNSQPRGVDSKNGLTIVACINHIVLFRSGIITRAHQVNFEPKQVAISPSGEVAVSGEQDKSIHIYQLSGEELLEQKCISFGQVAVALEYSPDGKYLAVAGAERSVVCYDTTDFSQIFDSKVHTSRVNCVSWNPSSTRFATGSIDTNTAVFMINETRRHIPNYAVFKGAHSQNQITAVRWIDDSTFLTAGQDSNIKKWKVEELAV